jgi:hypothetical protein
MHNLVQLAYVSRATALDASGRRRLLKQARADNGRRQLTGMLVSLGNLYIQALEGEAGMVEAVYNTIARDERHSQVTVLFIRPISARMFLPWRLGFLECRQAPLPTRLEDISAAAAERLLRQARPAMTIANRSAARALNPASANGYTKFSRASGGAYRRQVW